MSLWRLLARNEVISNPCHWHAFPRALEPTQMASSTESSSACSEKRASFFSNMHFLKAADLPRCLQMRHRKNIRDGDPARSK